MANQKVVKIINVKRSISKEKRFEQNIYKTNWLKNEAKLKSQGWLLESSIAEIVEEKVEDGKGEKTVTVETEVETEVEVIEENPLWENMSLEELQAECESKEIKYHKRSKEAKLIELLKENK